MKLPYIPDPSTYGVKTRQLSLNEEDSVVPVSQIPNVRIYLDCRSNITYGPARSLLGDLVRGKKWGETVSETPTVGEPEIWEVWNFTPDSHPIHIHQVPHTILNRQAFDPRYGFTGPAFFPEPHENGFKDTFVARPGQVTRILIKFKLSGLFVWHCHVLEHEDNEMMRPIKVKPASYSN